MIDHYSFIEIVCIIPFIETQTDAVSEDIILYECRECEYEVADENQIDFDIASTLSKEMVLPLLLSQGPTSK